MRPFLKSVSHAFKGLVFSLEQRNMKIILSCAVLTVLAAVFLKVNAGHWCILLICIGLVIALELINSAIEELVDLISPDHNEKAGKIKDQAAGAVFVVAIVSVIIAGIIFCKYVLALL